MLAHSVECAHLAAMMADELGASPKTARRAALLHDIGKAVSHEIEGPHALVGGDLARRHGESEAVAHAMEAHHNEVEPQTVEAVIVQAADALSGARPGARGESLEQYVKRLRDLEQIATRHDGVDKVYAMQAGREIRVMVVPGALDDDGAVLLSPRDRPRDRAGARVPGPDQGDRDPGVAGDGLRPLALVPWPPMKRFHVTTFGCQMNEHDSERMKGMLESLGYAEAPAREDADLILFNTCSIREKADERFVAHLREARALKRRDPERVIGVGGCWAQSVKDQVFRQFPFVDVAFGPGQVHKLAEFLTSDSLTAQGFFEFEGFTGHLPAKRGARRSRPGCRSPPAATWLLVLHRAVDARARGVAAARRARRRGARGWPPTASREVTLLGQNVNSYGARPAPAARDVRRAAARARRDRGHRPHPLHEPAPAGHARGRRSAPTPSCRRVCEHIHLPLQAGSSRVLKRDAPHLHARALPRPRRADPRARARTARSRPTSSSASRGRPRRTSRETLEVVEEVGFDGAFTFIYSPRRGTEAAEFADEFIPHEVQVERMERLVEVVQRRARERAQRFVGRTLDVLVEGTSRTTRRACAGARATTRSSTSTAWRAGRDRAGGRRVASESDARGRGAPARRRR